MQKVLVAFLVLVVGYHVVHTIALFGGGGLSGPEMALLRDAIWLFVVFVGLLMGWKQLLRLPRPWRFAVLGVVVLCLWSIGISLAQGGSSMDILVGFKYDIYPLLILLSSCVLGWVLYQKKTEAEQFFKRWSKRLFLLGGVLLIGGLIWQVLKILLPDFFVSIGYGPVGDYILGSNPPVYYRTGPDGAMRLQGLFAGPNNYGYRLVAISGFVFLLMRGFIQGVSRLGRIIFVILWLISLVWTLSRGAIVGAAVVWGLLIRLWYPAQRRWLWGLGLGVIVGAGLLSLVKVGSTIGHRDAWQQSVEAFRAYPWGYGLGAAGPSIHFDGIYLPENHYLQLLLDIGLPGALLWISVLAWIVLPWRDARKESSLGARLVTVLLAGMIGLLAEGVFLHSREDSMVLYLLFVPLGLIGGWRYHHSLEQSR